jgi:hypothetical protein
MVSHSTAQNLVQTTDCGVRWSEIFKPDEFYRTYVCTGTTRCSTRSGIRKLAFGGSRAWLRQAKKKKLRET